MQTNRRPSLAAPSTPAVNWQEYGSIDKTPTLARTLVSKENCKNFKATVAMVSHSFANYIETKHPETNLILIRQDGYKEVIEGHYDELILVWYII